MRVDDGFDSEVAEEDGQVRPLREDEHDRPHDDEDEGQRRQGTPTLNGERYAAIDDLRYQERSVDAGREIHPSCGPPEGLGAATFA
ncbi:MAG TPA: hypothetical protein VHT05_13315 [Candidatus Elarobacter sp.]|jgi:hypothetical protein|nr:hypothetical protein [Candidatus Elarobacter sp.]